jgi:hypothetical protein
MVTALIGAVATILATLLPLCLSRPVEPPQANIVTQQRDALRQLPQTQPDLEHGDKRRPAPPNKEPEKQTPPISAGEEDFPLFEGEIRRPRLIKPGTARANGAARDLPEQPQFPAERTKGRSPTSGKTSTTGQAPALLVEVEALARLENFRVPDERPFLALAEDIDLTIAGNQVRLSLARNRAREASKSLDLPEGQHRYTLRSRARARCFPGGGGFSFVLCLSGNGRGKILVKRGSRLILAREACQGSHYTTRLEQGK